jgi:hypothetical protein
MAKQEETKQNVPTIDEAIHDMKITKLFHITKDGKFDSIVVKKYLKDKEKYLPFIKEENREEFMTEYSQIFQELKTENDSDAYAAFRLQSWEHSGDIMMLLNDNTDWDVVDNTLHLQGHTGGTFSCLTSKVLHFSPYGLDFVEHIYGIEERIKTEEKINKDKKRKKLSCR